MKEPSSLKEFDAEVEFMSLVVESILFASEPSFSVTEERSPDEYFRVLTALKASNPAVFERINLKNIELLFDDSCAESALISNITQLLGDKLTIVDARE